ncbi:MAG: class I SAM-dependent methyltransferase [Desulfovibrionaceae bacterium]
MDTILSSFLEVHVAEQTWKLEKPASLDVLWDTLTQQELDDERIPYWSELWNSSLALSEFLNTKKILLQNRYCLDIGCGLGLTSLVPASFGALVCAMDYQSKALLYLRKNIQHNRQYLRYLPVSFAMDWRYPAYTRHSFSYIWAADILYERAFIPHIVQFIDFTLKKEGIFWLADCDRGFQEKAILHFLSQDFIVNKVTLPNTIKQNNMYDAITLWEITKEISQ